MNHAEDLRAVDEWSFLADDLKLYLDTHPAAAHALAAPSTALAERSPAVAAFEKEHGALTHDGLLFQQNYDWVDRPFPFE